MHAIKKRLPKLLRAVADLGQRFKVNIQPHHFYSEVPDMRALRNSTYWRRPWDMTGVLGADAEAQFEFARQAVEPWKDRLADGAMYKEACRRNGEEGYGPIEADMLYGFLRTHKPPKIVQVGCGVTTAIAEIVTEDEPGYQPEIVCVEPYPTPNLQRMHDAGKIRLIKEGAERVALEALIGIEAGGLLFVDSTHTNRVGGEVPRLMLEVIPRLKPGVFVHFHDIVFPYDYTPVTLDVVFLWRESPMLHALLINNPSLGILASMSMMHHASPERLQSIFPRFMPMPMEGGVSTGPGHYPSSIFLRTY